MFSEFLCERFSHATRMSRNISICIIWPQIYRVLNFSRHARSDLRFFFNIITKSDFLSKGVKLLQAGGW